MTGAAVHPTDHGLRPRLGWRTFLWVPLIISFLLFVLPQASFIWMSLHRNLGFGRVGTTLTLSNYVRVLTDELYLDALITTLQLSLIATLLAIALAFPMAYMLVRMRWRFKSVIIDLLLVAALVTVVIKVHGLSVILGDSGVINLTLRSLGLTDQPIRLLYTKTGVVIGLIQYTLPLLVMIFFSVVQTIPENLEEAAEVHGATKFRTFFLVLLPLAKVGVLAGGLIVFNLNAGAFTSAILLGGGKVLTLPVVIYRKVSLGIDYPMGATLSTMLLVTVFTLNLIGGACLARLGRRR
ncbi:MAG: ABC transporter permease [Alphaproteobacteria bacterium]|nr:ABC transporter permease [Alphaproteobacteria bacterium]